MNRHGQRIGEPASRWRMQVVPIATVMIASALPLMLPLVASAAPARRTPSRNSIAPSASPVNPMPMSARNPRRLTPLQPQLLEC